MACVQHGPGLLHTPGTLWVGLLNHDLNTMTEKAQIDTQTWNRTRAARIKPECAAC